jgi:DNA-binding transcriptional LysR family regulator
VFPPLRTLQTTSSDVVRAAFLSGLGIGCLPDFLARQPLSDGRLRTVLDAYLDAPGQFHLLWLSNRHLSPKVRVFVEFLGERLFADRCERAPAIQATR